jgi:hypothetical protein
VIAFEFRSDATARRNLAHAHALAIELAGRSLVYRPPRPSEFARLTCELDGHAETILLPLINNILVYAAIAVEAVAGNVRRMYLQSASGFWKLPASCFV